jgi:hypothetical protein
MLMRRLYTMRVMRKRVRRLYTMRKCQRSGLRSK